MRFPYYCSSLGPHYISNTSQLPSRTGWYPRIVEKASRDSRLNFRNFHNSWVLSKLATGRKPYSCVGKTSCVKVVDAQRTQINGEAEVESEIFPPHSCSCFRHITLKTSVRIRRIASSQATHPGTCARCVCVLGVAHFQKKWLVCSAFRRFSRSFQLEHV